MHGPMAALRLLIGWVLVIGFFVFVVENPDRIMAAIDFGLEAIAHWVDMHVNVS